MHQYSDQIERIKLKLPIARRRDRNFKVFGAESHKYKIKKPATLQNVKAFESKYSLTLPPSFRAFVLEVGNGGVSYANSGAGPHYGIYPLGKYANDLGINPKKLNQNCILEPNLTDDQWKELNRKIEENDDISDEEYEIERSKIFGGVLPIGSQGCTYIHAIILNGKYRDKVVNLDIDWQKPKFTHENNFLDWYERWLDEVILNKLTDASGSFGYSERTSKFVDVSTLKKRALWDLKSWTQIGDLFRRYN